MTITGVTLVTTIVTTVVTKLMNKGDFGLPFFICACFELQLMKEIRDRGGLEIQYEFQGPYF